MRQSLKTLQKVSLYIINIFRSGENNPWAPVGWPTSQKKFLIFINMAL